MNIHPLRPRDHEDAGRVAISSLAERQRKGWRSAFEGSDKALIPLGIKALRALSMFGGVADGNQNGDLSC